MYEEYMKKINEEDYSEEQANDEYNLIFKYVLNDAWHRPIKSIFITLDNNVYLNNNLKTIETATVDNKKIEMIVNKYLNKLSKIKKENLPFTGVLDGNINVISFKINNKWYLFEYNNIGYYSNDVIDEDNQLKIIFSFLNELYDLFNKENKNICNYFTLTD